MCCPSAPRCGRRSHRHGGWWALRGRRRHGLRVERSPLAPDLPGGAGGTRPGGIDGVAGRAGDPRGGQWPGAAGGRALMPELDVSIQPPARLKLMTTLTAVSEAEFATLRDTLQVSDSVLSKHVAALVAVGYANSRKGIRAGRRTTWISLTARITSTASHAVDSPRPCAAGAAR